MNVVEIDAASNNRVDDIRQVIEEVQYSPAQEMCIRDSKKCFH